MKILIDLMWRKWIKIERYNKKQTIALIEIICGDLTDKEIKERLIKYEIGHNQEKIENLAKSMEKVLKDNITKLI